MNLDQKIESNWVELGLRVNENPPAVPFQNRVTAEIRRLLDVVADAAVEGDGLPTTEFRAELTALRQRLESTFGEPEFVTALQAAVCACDDYFRKARHHLAEREAEFAEVIEVLRTALGQVTGDSQTFNKRMIDATDRFKKIGEIQDIREIKHQIILEVTELKKTVEEKQKQDVLTFSKLNRRIEELQANLSKASEEASLDPQTRVSNRGSFDRALRQWSAVKHQQGQPFIVAMLDLDDFKKINDTYGHPVGDRVLVCASQWFARYVRQSDFLARYGGEEFAILLSDLKLNQAEAKFADLLARIAGYHYEYEVDGQRRRIAFTVSCGIAECGPTESAEEALQRADQALYEAKRRGKNRVVSKRRSVFAGLFRSRDDAPAATRRN